MNDQNGKSLDEVLDAMLFEHGIPTIQAVAEWTARHPEHRAAIIEFAAAWAEDDHLPAPRVDNLRDRSVAAATINQFRTAVAAPNSLAGMAAARGRSMHDLARGTGIDTRILMKLNARRIAPATIGRAMALRIGKFLEIEPSSVIASWTGTHTPLAAAAFLAGSVSLPQETLRQAMERIGVSPELITEMEGD